MSVVDEIKAKLDIVDYIQRTVPLKKAGRTWKAPCPFHSERTPSFVVDADKQYYRCYGACNESGDIFSFAMKQNGWSFREALEELGKLAGVEVRQQSPEQKQQYEHDDRLRGLLATIADFYRACLFDTNNPKAIAALNYARTKRGLTDDTLAQFKIGYAPDGWQHSLDYLTNLGYSAEDIILAGVATHKEDSGRTYDRFRNRLMIPISDDRGRVIGFGARALDPGDEPKYLNSPQTPVFDKSHVLYGLDLAKKAIRDTETAVIVEGYLDVIQAHQAGYTNVIAQMGTAMTEPQLKQIAPKWAKYIVMALDADAAGQSATRRGLEVARQTLSEDFTGRMSVDIRILSIPGAKDPDDFIREAPDEWPRLVKESIPVADYLIATEIAALPADPSVQEREAVARRLLPLLLATENHLYQQDNLQKLALKLRIAERDLLAWADEQQQIAQAKAAQQARRQAQQPPEPPPLDDSYLEPPPDVDDELSALPTPAPREVALEAQCLGLLFQNPELYYHVNRKFRELAGANPHLAQGPLADLCAEDFTRDDYRVLMLVFQAALEQHDLDTITYMRQELPPGLETALNVILRDDVEGMKHRLGNRQSADLIASLKQIGRFHGAGDLTADMIEKALRLRAQRLQREFEEIVFLQMDAEHNADADQLQLLTRKAEISRHAKRQIDASTDRRQMLLN
jgi:DNA primase